MNVRRLFLIAGLFSIVSICLLEVVRNTATSPIPTFTQTKTVASVPIKTGGIEPWWNGERYYVLGVNYPWLHYGHDFGTTAWGHDGASNERSREQIDADFGYLKSQGVHVVRWFLFGDARGSPEFDANGKVTGFDEKFYPDVDAALASARKHDIYLILVLFDFLLAEKAKDVNGVQLGGRSQVITDPKKRRSLLANALKPLLERYGKDRNIIAWDVMNEPEGAMDIPGGRWVGEPVSTEAMQVFVNEVSRCIHSYSRQHVTVGSASREWLGYWTGSRLDFYQYHYYDKMENRHPLDYAYADLSLDKPCIVGEFPTKNAKRTMKQHLDTVSRNGYAGALAWSYRADDESSDFNGAAGEFAAWSDAHRSDVDIQFRVQRRRE